MRMSNESLFQFLILQFPSWRIQIIIFEVRNSAYSTQGGLSSKLYIWHLLTNAQCCQRIRSYMPCMRIVHVLVHLIQLSHSLFQTRFSPFKTFCVSVCTPLPPSTRIKCSEKKYICSIWKCTDPEAAAKLKFRIQNLLQFSESLISDDGMITSNSTYIIGYIPKLSILKYYSHLTRYSLKNDIHSKNSDAPYFHPNFKNGPQFLENLQGNC